MYPQSMSWSKNKKTYKKFPTENFHFLQLKKSMFIAWASFGNEDKLLHLDNLPPDGVPILEPKPCMVIKNP